MEHAPYELSWIRARPWVLRVLGVAPVLALLVLFNVTGFRGVNLGYHWDEADWHMKPARQMVSSGILLPRSYIYPSFDKWLILMPAAPAGLREAFDTGGKPLPIQAALLSAMDVPDYLLTVRRLFIAVSSLGILWVFGAALALRHRWWEALVAAASLGLSWEYAYHARWVVTDTILVQFSALTLFMLALFQRTANVAWLYAAAVAAGLSTGTKYTGVFLLVPVLFASCLTLPFYAYLAQVRRAAVLCLLAFVVYLVTTPGTVLDIFTFLRETHYISKYYAHSHGGFTAASAWDHARIVGSYFALAYFSPYLPLAAVLFAGVVAGGVLSLRRDLRFSAVLVGFPLLFLLFFCAKFRVVMVRNYLFLVPFMALLLARGMGEFAQWLARPWRRRCLAGALLGVVAAQAAWLSSAGESIRHIDPNAYVRQALAYVRAHADIRFRVSEQVRSLARAEHLALPPNVTEASEPAAEVVFFGRGEGPDLYSWKVNDPWLTKAVFGPREVNFNWYSSWSGHDRVVVMAIDKAKATGVPLAQ